MAAAGVEGLLADMVSIPSMNPMGRERSGPAYSEKALGMYVADVLRSHGIDVEVDESDPGRPNIVGRVDTGAPRTILLEAHLDTVHADNMRIDPFSPVVREGRLYGRGACDTKGSLAAFLQALVSTLEENRLSWNVIFAAVSDEEYRFTGARRLMERGLRADCGIAGEPTQLRIVRAHKGVTRWRIVTRGIAAHSAFPERGKNAIIRMAHVLAVIDRYASSLKAGPVHPLLGPRTLSVGVIEGGQAVNIVPDRCRIEIDRRTLPGETTAVVMEEIRDLLRGFDDVAIEDPHLSVGGMETAMDAAIVLRLVSAVEKVTGDAVVESAPYATDAGIYAGAGIPMVVFGPGDIADAHTADESIRLDQLHQAVEIVRSVLQ